MYNLLFRSLVVIVFNDSSMLMFDVSNLINGLLVFSYISSIPVKLLISLALAFLYNPFGSLFSQTSIGIEI